MQPVSACQDGLASYAEQPEPVPLQVVSVQPRTVPLARVSVVPPTAVTSGEAAGYDTPYPAPFPSGAVIATPGWAK